MISVENTYAVSFKIAGLVMTAFFLAFATDIVATSFTIFFVVSDVDVLDVLGSFMGVLLVLVPLYCSYFLLFKTNRALELSGLSEYTSLNLSEEYDKLFLLIVKILGIVLFSYYAMYFLSSVVSFYNIIENIISVSITDGLKGSLFYEESESKVKYDMIKWPLNNIMKYAFLTGTGLFLFFKGEVILELAKKKEMTN